MTIEMYAEAFMACAAGERDDYKELWDKLLEDYGNQPAVKLSHERPCD